MKILVFVKHEIDTDDPFRMVSASKSLNASGLTPIPDKASVAALSLVLSVFPASEHEIDVVSVGNADAEETLRACLSYGAQRAIRIWDDALEGKRPVGDEKASVLASLAKEYDLVACGTRSTSGMSGFTGPAVAEKLGWPIVGSTTCIEAQGDRIILKRKLDFGNREIIQAQTPLLITVDEGCAEPPYPSLPAMIFGQESDVDTFSFNACLRESNMVGAKDSFGKTLEYLPPKPRTRMSGSLDASGLSSASMMQMLSGVGSSNQGSKVVKGSPAKCAEAFVELLSGK